MRLNVDQLPPSDRSDFMAAIRRVLLDIMQQVNLTTEGRKAAYHSAMTAAPTTGAYAVGDFVPNVNRGLEYGNPNGKYTVSGWVCSSDAPLTFLEVRCLSGN